MIGRSSWPGSMRWQAQMAEEADTTFQEVFSQASSTDSIELLLWCISSTVCLCYMSEVLATTTQQEEDIPGTITVPKLEDLQAQDPADSPAHQAGTPPLSSASLSGYSLCWHSLSWVLLCGIQCWPLTENMRLLLQWHPQ